MTEWLSSTPRQFISITLLMILFILVPSPNSALAAAPDSAVLYQGRQEHPGITIRLYNQPTPLTTTDSGGHFSLQQLNDGTYWLAVEAPLYLPDYIEATVTDGKVTVASTVVLSGGDLNQDHKIDISDAALLGANFESTNPEADINADGQVNLLDLAIIGGNLGKTAPPPPLKNDSSDNSTPSQTEDTPPTTDKQEYQIYLPVVFR